MFTEGRGVRGADEALASSHSSLGFRLGSRRASIPQIHALAAQDILLD